MNEALFRDAAQRVRTRMLGMLLVWACGAASPVLAASAAPEPAPVFPFDRYHPFRDEPVQDWRAVNDRVGEIGGWRTYLRESQPDAGTGSGDRGGHGHHGHHGH